MKLVIIDTQAGNLGSVYSAFKRIGSDPLVSNKKEDIEAATALVLPGVGAFEHGMKNLHKLGLVELIKKKACVEKTPIIGICLGMQLLADTSTETNDGSELEGLGLVSGKVKRLKGKLPDFLVPNIGWYDVVKSKESSLFPDSYSTKAFYHVHSYFFDADDNGDVAACINYGGQNVVVALEKNNVFGAQFHPEKSQDAGLDYLKRFVDYVKEKA